MTRTSVKQGWVSDLEYQHWRLHGVPNSWCSWAGGPSTKCVSNEEMATLVEGGSRAPSNTYTIVKWSVTYGEVLSTFLAAMERAREASGVPTDQLRICCFFDS